MRAVASRDALDCSEPPTARTPLVVTPGESSISFGGTTTTAWRGSGESFTTSGRRRSPLRELPPRSPTARRNTLFGMSSPRPSAQKGEQLPPHLCILPAIAAAARHPPPVTVVEDDFSSEHTFELLHQGTDAFRARCPATAVFAALRRSRGVSQDGWVASWGEGVTAMQRSEGKSGASFSFSSDRRFLVKTLREDECALLMRLLRGLWDHLERYPSSLLNRPCAVLVVDTGSVVQHYVVLENLTAPPAAPSMLFDLKGSTQGRSGKEAARQQSRERVPVLKDNDFRSMDLRVMLHECDASQILRQLQYDALLLASWGVMDYSLLLGIEVKKAVVTGSWPEWLNSLESPEGRYRYYFGVIDYLQEFTTKKRLAAAIKGVTAERASLSTVPANDYADRFVKFLEDVVFRATAAPGDPAGMLSTWCSNESFSCDTPNPSDLSETGHFTRTVSGRILRGDSRAVYRSRQEGVTCGRDATTAMSAGAAAALAGFVCITLPFHAITLAIVCPIAAIAGAFVSGRTMNACGSPPESEQRLQSLLDRHQNLIRSPVSSGELRPIPVRRIPHRS